MNGTATTPGPALRDARYQDLCGFFKSMGGADDWAPRVGDWVVRRPGDGLGVIVAIDGSSLRVTPADGGEPYAGERDEVIWLPTLDQLRSLMLDSFGTCGPFTSSFNGRAWWFSGNIMGMTITNLVPLAEGGSAEEAAVNALLMRQQR